MRCQRLIYAGGLMSPMQRCFSDGLSKLGDILRHRRLSLFGQVARLDHGVTAHDALNLMVDTYTKACRKASCREKTAGSPSQLVAQQDSEECQCYTAIYAVGN